MERDNFNRFSFESSEEKPDDKKEEKKKKSATGLARLIAREEAKAETEKQPETDDRTMLQKLMGEAKPEQVEQSETAGDEDEEVDDTPLDSLSAEEVAAVAETYVENRSEQLAHEVIATEQTAEEAAETQADQAFLEALQRRLTEQGEDVDVDEAIEAAFENVASDITTETEHDEAANELEPRAPEASDPQEFNPDQPIPLAGSGASQPPLPPRRGAGPAMPFGGGAGTAGRGTPNTAPKQYDDADVQRFERSAMGRGLLVGGVIGYLIGRRRGRIKTEKRLKTVQTKLEKQVTDVQQKLEQKEIAIRKLAREHIAAMPAAAERPATIVSRSAAPRTIERPSNRGASGETAQPRTSPDIAKEAIDTLSKEELLAYSAQIKVGETSLRRVYEAQLIDEKGLRRLIREYQAGHDLRRALAREFMMKELKFERDPSLRDLLPPEAQPRNQAESRSSTDNGGVEGGTIAARANGSAGSAAESAARTATDPTQSAPAKPQSFKSSRQQNVSPAVLTALTLLTIGLAIYAVWLTFTK